MNIDENLCLLCKKSFNSITMPKKICRYCGKNVCSKCSSGKVQSTSGKKRICDRCFQINLQKSILSSSSQGILSLVEEKKEKDRIKLVVDAEIRQVEKDLALANEYLNEIRNLHSKELVAIREKRMKLEESLNVLNGSLKNIEQSEEIYREKIEVLKQKVQSYNENLIWINQDQSELDDRIYQAKEMLCNTMNENETLHAVVNEELTEFVVKGKFLKKRIDKFHRRTLGNIEAMNSDVAFLSVQVRELENRVQEKRLELNLKKEMYNNAHLYLSVDN